MKKIGFYVLFSIFLSLIPWRLDAASGTPMQAVKELDKRLDSYKVGKTLTPADIDFNRKLKEEVLRGTFDIGELSKVSLGKHWDTISATDQKAFVELMTQLLEHKAIFSKEQSQTQGKSYRINYQKESFIDAQKQVAQVFTEVVVPKDNIHLNLSYKLKRINDVWKIFDVIVDQSSLVRNYAFQFNAIITKSGYPELVRRMKSKLTEFESNNKVSTPTSPAKP